MSPDPAAAPEHPDIAGNLRRVRERIAAAAARSGRAPDAVRLVAVTKRVEAARVAAAVRAGATDLGENYVQEARDKVPAVADLLRDAAPPTWHLIGHLQSNKAKYSVGLFYLIQSVDNLQLAQEIGKQAAKHQKTQPILIEVNLARNPARAGVLPEDAAALAERVAALPHVALHGYMGMAPFFADGPEGARPFFRELFRLWERLPDPNRRVLSMGMSGDFEVAVEEGATLVRVGTALFGARKAE